MLDTKFIKLFLQLNRKEKQNLKLWVHSPFANAREDVTQLFDFIYAKRTITAENTDRKLAFQYVYPNKKYNEQQLRYVMSFATKCMEDFLAYNEWQTNKTNTQLALIRNINHKNANLYTTQEIKETTQLINQQKLRNSNFFWQTYQLETERYTLQSKNKRYEDFNLQAVADNLHYYTIAEILKYACVAISYEQVSGKSFQFYLINECMALIEKETKLNTIPAIHIYYLCYKISTNGNDDLFQQLYKAVYAYETFFDESEMKDIILLTINYCIKELNIGKQNYAQHAYDLYLHALQKGYLLDKGELSRFTFKNIVFIGVKKLKEYKSVELFITKFQNALHEQYRENTVLFNMATLYVAKKEYKRAMPILQQVEFEDVLWNLDAKSMLLRIYFEEKEYEAMFSLVKSFKTYLHRQKTLGIYKTRYKNMIHYCEKIYKHIGVSKPKKNLLKNEIETHANLPEKEWFLEQVDLL
jgi:hypothetical protein